MVVVVEEEEHTQPHTIFFPVEYSNYNDAKKARALLNVDADLLRVRLHVLAVEVQEIHAALSGSNNSRIQIEPCSTYSITCDAKRPAPALGSTLMSSASATTCWRRKSRRSMPLFPLPTTARLQVEPVFYT